ncbi:MAG: helix-turn-helix domain-containing protein [Alphaproteobacteria bacterium]|nr:helix-turn-helix domain-containing protein [Alphaproteobacteria bacterium]
MHLGRLISVLETVAVAGRPVSASELQQATSLPRPTCYRLLQTLAEHRLLDDPNGNSRYLVGERLIRIALLGKTDVDVCQAAAPSLAEAAVVCGEAVFLSRFRNKGVEIIHVETPADKTRSFIHPGLGFRPMHACSCSKAIAAFAEEDFREDILKGPMKTYTDHTHTDEVALRKEFCAIQAQGYAECVEEIEIGVSSVAAPVVIGNVGATFSVGAIGPIRRFTPDYRAKMGADLRALAGKVSSAIQLYGTSQTA